MGSDSGILPFSSRTRPECRSRQPHEQGPPGVVLQVTHHPVGSFPPTGGKVVTANAFGILGQFAQKVVGFQGHMAHSTPIACMWSLDGTTPSLSLKHRNA
jgi:hypothetical protein